LFGHDLRANALGVCREGKPVPTFPDHALHLAQIFFTQQNYSRLCFFADLFSAMRASRRRWPNDMLDESVARCLQAGGPLFFSTPLVRAATLEQGVSDHGHQCAMGQSRIIVTRDLNLFVNIP
jgi:hypothetical protein